MTAVLPEEDRTEGDVPYNHGWSYDIHTTPKLVSSDGILHRFHRQLFPRDSWLIRKRLGEDKAHLEPLDQRKKTHDGAYPWRPAIYTTPIITARFLPPHAVTTPSQATTTPLLHKGHLLHRERAKTRKKEEGIPVNAVTFITIIDTSLSFPNMMLSCNLSPIFVPITFMYE